MALLVVCLVEMEVLGCNVGVERVFAVAIVVFRDLSGVCIVSWEWSCMELSSESESVSSNKASAVSATKFSKR